MDRGEPSFPSAPFQIRSALNGLLLTPIEASRSPCRVTVLKPLDGEAGLRQLWTYQDGGFICNAATGLCLDYEGSDVKKFVGVVFVCVYPRKSGQEAHNQRWLARAGGLIACHDDINRVLDIRGDNKEPGSEILLYKLKSGREADGGLNQRWTFEVPLDGLPGRASTQA